MDYINGFNYQNQMVGSPMSNYSEQRNLPHLPQKPTKTKRFRAVYTAIQVSTLEAEYKKNQYVQRTRRAEIAMELNLSDRQVKVWFQNKRMYSKQTKKNPSSTSTVSSPESVNSCLSLEEIGSAFEADSVTSEVKSVEDNVSVSLPACRYEMKSYPRPVCRYDMQPHSHSYQLPECRYVSQPYNHTYSLPPCQYDMNSYQNFNKNCNFIYPGNDINANNSATNFNTNFTNYQNNNFIKNADNNFVNNFEKNLSTLDNSDDLPGDLKLVTPFLSDQ